MMSAAQQASSELASAKTAHAAALDALRVAKQEFFEAPTEPNRLKVVKLEEALSGPTLLVERAEFQLKKAQREAAEAARVEQTAELAEVRKVDAAQNAQARRAVVQLAALEKEAYSLIDELAAISHDQIQAFHTRKRLALALGEPLPERPPPTALERSRDVADEIALAHREDGRFNKPNARQVSTWLAPSVWVPARAKTA